MQGICLLLQRLWGACETILLVGCLNSTVNAEWLGGCLRIEKIRGRGNVELRERLAHCTMYAFPGRTLPPEMSASHREFVKFAFGT